MHKFTKLCLRKPVSTVIIIMALAIFGITSVLGMNMQLTPDMVLPMIIAYTVYPQAGPEEVDRLVTQELEQVGATIEGLDSISSQSLENVSYMIYSFKYGTDIDEAYTDLQQEINAVKGNLPEECLDPVLVVMDINAVQSMTLSVTSDTGADVRSFVENSLEPKISSVANVASTTVIGGQEDYIRIQVIPELLSEYGLDMATLATYITSSDFSIPASLVDMGSQTLNVNAKVTYDTIYDLENIPILTGRGGTIRLGDVAVVSFAQKDADSISRFNGEDNVTLDITKKQGSNAVELSKDVKAVIAEMAEDYPEMQIEVIYDSSTSIVSSLTSVGETLVLGVVLSMLVLFIFFGDFKASLIVGSSMPVSLLVTLLLMGACGFSLNVVTMGAMVIGIGMMVDNSIVVLEMCFQKRDEGRSFEESAYDAVKTVAMSITASTITTIVVYLPLALMKGLSGQIFGQLGFTIIFSLTASLIAAVTLIPLCFAKYHPIEKKEFPVARGVRTLAKVYGRFLEKVLNKKIIAILVTAGLVALTGFGLTQLHTQLMAQSDEGTISMSVDVKPGLGLQGKDELLQELEAFVSSDADVNSYNVSASQGTSTINVTVYLKPDRSRSTLEIVDEWNVELADMKNAEVLCTSTSSMSMGSMGTDSKEVDIRCVNMEQLKEASALIADAIKDVPGVVSVETDFQDSTSKAEIAIDPVKATGAGILPAQAASAVYAAKNGTDVMDLAINEKDYTVTLEYPAELYENIADLMNMSLTTNFGTSITLSDIAEIKYTDSPQMIKRTDGYYQAAIIANLTDDLKYEAMDEIDDIVAGLKMPSGVTMAEDSYTQMITEEFTSIFQAILIALWLVFMVMTMQFESARYSGMIMFCIPFSLIGSVMMLWISGIPLDMTSMMGFLMLEGIVVNNGILMVDTTNQFLETMTVEKALVEAGKSRLRPILMTTLTTILSMVPMALGLGSNGQMMQGMAMVIVGGLVASTLLTLVLLPTIYMIIRKRPKRVKKQKETAQA